MLAAGAGGHPVHLADVLDPAVEGDPATSRQTSR
jgi:hypothetical protein